MRYAFVYAGQFVVGVKCQGGGDRPVAPGVDAPSGVKAGLHGVAVAGLVAFEAMGAIGLDVSAIVMATLFQ